MADNFDPFLGLKKKEEEVTEPVVSSIPISKPEAEYVIPPEHETEDAPLPPEFEPIKKKEFDTAESAEMDENLSFSVKVFLLGSKTLALLVQQGFL